MQQQSQSRKRKLYFASQSQLILLHEKDSEYVAQIAAQITDVLDVLHLSRWVTVLGPEIYVLAQALYYGFTIGLGRQTLGQEYVDCFFAVASSTPAGTRVSAMTTSTRTTLIVIRAAVSYLAHRSDQIYNALLVILRKFHIPRLPTSSSRSAEQLLAILRFISDIHLLFFFANGRFYDYAMRLLSVRMLTNQQFRSHRDQLGFQSLILVLGLRLVLEAISAARRHLSASTELPEPELASSSTTNTTQEASNSVHLDEDQLVKRAVKCPLCMGDVINPSATPCGHVFCWTCVMNWCQNSNKSECALCRRPMKPQDILPLYNYADMINR